MIKIGKENNIANMKDKNVDISKARVYALITISVVSIVMSIFVIVGSIYVESEITKNITIIYKRVDLAYQKSDDAIKKTQTLVDKVQDSFNEITPTITMIAGTDRQNVLNTIDALSTKVSTAQKSLINAKSRIRQTNERIDIVNSLGVVTLPKPSGERVQNASNKVDEILNNLDTIKKNASNGQASENTVTKVNRGIENTQNSLDSYNIKISDARKNTKRFKDLLIFWSTLGTISIVSFFIWSIYSSCYLMRNQLDKLKR